MFAHVRRLHAPRPTAAHGANSVPQGHELTRRPRSCPGSDAYQFSICLFRDLASAGFAQVGTQTNSSAMPQIKHQSPNVRSRKLTIRELDRPFETAPNTTREHTSPRSRVIRLRRLIRLSSSKFQQICLFAFEKTGTKYRVMLGDSKPFQTKADVFSLFLQPNRTGRASPPA